MFAYQFGDVIFQFDVIRAAGQTPDLMEDRTLGPICVVYIKQDQPSHLGSSYGQFEVTTIRDFMLQFSDPWFPSPVPIEEVRFYPSDEFHNHSYKR